MKKENLKYILLALIVIVGTALALLSWARPEVTKGGENENPNITKNTLGAVATSEDGIEVSVTPKTLSNDAWNFEVVLNTHSVELSYDLAETSVLVGDNGNTFKALAWEGDPPGGHHRRGVLKFNSIYPRQGNIELRIGLGDKERSFKWTVLQ